MAFEGKERFPLSLEPWDLRDCTQHRQKWASLVQRSVPLKWKPTAVMSVHACLLRVKGSENRQERNRGSKSVTFGNRHQSGSVNSRVTENKPASLTSAGRALDGPQ